MALPPKQPIASRLSPPASAWSRGGRRGVSWLSHPVALGLVSAVLLCGHAGVTGQLFGPPRHPDGRDYDAIACGLARGQGFAADYRNPDFWAAYPTRTAPHPAAEMNATVDRTAMRPPALPTALALSHTAGRVRSVALADRSFVPIRLLMIACVAITVGLIARAVTDLAGPLASLALVVPLTIAADWRFREMSRSVLTEAPSLLLMTAAAVVAAHLVAKSRRNDLPTSSLFGPSLGLGVLLGFAVLVRSMTALQLPLLFAGLFLVVRDRRMIVAAAATTAVVVAPWIVRNVQVAGSDLPLGTQGATELPAGYSDAAWNAGGLWRAESRHAIALEDPAAVAGIADEVAIARANRDSAKQWAFDHPFRAMALAARKVANEFGSHSAGKLCFWLLAIAGMWQHRRHPLAVVAVLWIASTLASVAVTWSVGGRFLWPVLAMPHIFVAVSLWQVLALAFKPADTTDG